MPNSSLFSAKLQANAIKWAKSRQTRLRQVHQNGERLWSDRAIAKQIVAEAERIYNAGMARVIAKTLESELKVESDEEKGE